MTFPIYLIGSYLVGFILYIIILSYLKTVHGYIEEYEAMGFGMIFITSPISLFVVFFICIVYVFIEIIPNLINKL